MVKIENVQFGSLAAKAKIAKGDMLVSVNGNEIEDILDYQFYTTEKKLALSLLRDGEELCINITKKDEYDELGLEFESYLMDNKRSCKNACIFCFIDQNPHGMRESIYFKDDDSRLSFFFGNYITLTNLSQKDVDRIIKMRISPINISVHTTNKELRVFMMKNKNAGSSLKYLDDFCRGEIAVNCQIVLCRGVNDGEELKKTISDLLEYENVNSIAVVPAGLTACREGLFKLSPFDKEECRAVLETVDHFGQKSIEKRGTRTVYASDEFYLKAELPIPNGEYYEDYPQIENGVGMISSMRDEAQCEKEALLAEGFELLEKRSVSIATSKAAYGFICKLVESLKEKWYNLDCKVYECENKFFSGSVNVAGLLTGSDYYDALCRKPLGDMLFISSSSLRFEQDLFLDNMSKQELEEKLGVKISATSCDGAEFVRAILGAD